MKIHSLLFFLSACCAMAAEFPFQYVPEKLPQESTPEWRLWKPEESTAQATLVNHELNIKARSDQRFAYLIGIFDIDKKAGAGPEAWDASKGGTTVEFRVKCHAETAQTEVFAVSLSDGTKSWAVSFSPSRIKCSGKVETLDATKVDTYRLTLSDQKLRVTSARRGTIFENVEGSENEKNSNRLLFGSMGGKKNGSVSISWDLNFIRWTNDAAIDGKPSAD